MRDVGDVGDVRDARDVRDVGTVRDVRDVMSPAAGGLIMNFPCCHTTALQSGMRSGVGRKSKKKWIAESKV